ncbi:hypothetical protein [Vibrio phage LP.1]|nr:hypothetical protein [Vibrio phage LP.1]
MSSPDEKSNREVMDTLNAFGKEIHGLTIELRHDREARAEDRRMFEKWRDEYKQDEKEQNERISTLERNQGDLIIVKRGLLWLGGLFITSAIVAAFRMFGS